MASERNLGDLIVRVRKAQRNLGPRNPYRVLLDECVEAVYAVVRQYGDLREAYEQATKRDPGLAGDARAGNAAREDLDGAASDSRGDAEPEVTLISHPADAGDDAGYGHAV